MEEYIAGFFDGEGNINKIKVKGKTQYQLRIYQAGDEGLRLLNEIKTFLGYGWINKRDRRNKHPKWKILYELHITKKSQVLDFKYRIGKFCRLKKFPEDDELQDLRLKEKNTR